MSSQWIKGLSSPTVDWGREGCNNFVRAKEKTNLSAKPLGIRKGWKQMQPLRGSLKVLWTPLLLVLLCT